MGWSSKKDKVDAGSSDAGLEKQKSSLFGRSKAPKSSATPAASNPYAAAPPTNDPYAQRNTNPYANQAGPNDPYAPRSQSSLTQPPTSSFGSLTLKSEAGTQPPSYQSGPAPNRYEKSPVPQGGYGGAPRYQSQGNGQANGYGNANPYGNDRAPAQSQYGSGGYGGFGGRGGSQETITTDAGRQQLFGDAPSRAQKAQDQGPATNPEQNGDSSYENSGGYGAPGAYGYGEERELTAEEIEDQEVQGTKDQIRDLKRSDVSATRNAIRITEQIEQTGRDTLARLGRQGDMLHNAESHLDKAGFENKRAEEKARELKTLNRSMFAVQFKNPVGRDKRFEKDIQHELEKHKHQRKTVEDSRESRYDSQVRKEGAQRDLRGKTTQPANPERKLADRSRFQFEADSDDDQMEDEIDDNLAALHEGAKTINRIGKSMGAELESQNKHLERISKKTDKVDDQIAMNRARLDRIK
ncbi:Protein transport protein S9 plasma membrane t-SNARE [Recurvomyces mirabilis]|uniref:Protein transport protein S9 plasma membrane t-SNARE n=1 Tax=Recurvomyces mirabilis TaxID=574656 RepID=A0AAE0WPV2_9PEZI|nr:Protein transport protein S9 plasma membrane t-SNARE [Recurvomyces mirabilis]KAK5156043.1 Protein transport protein S9 plasma membrane t-SNARE [Recurvomyces mirabilis]